MIGGLFALPSIPQSQAYHAFANTRHLLGVPNFLDVVSNAAFVLVGGAGFGAVCRAGRTRDISFTRSSDRWPYVLFFLSVALTGLGSAYYHLAPDNARLMWDRLPMALAFAALFSAVVTERIEGTVGTVLLVPVAVASVASVLYWHVTEAAGHGDLRPYLFVQFYPVLAIPLIMYLFPSRYSRGGDLLAAAALYAVAKGFEALDAVIFALGRIVSGHTLKHLTAAAATVLIIRMLQRKRPVPAGENVFSAAVR
jgi:hypothetical protein